MKLSKSSAHAALALAYLAGRTEQSPIQARQIADHLGIPIDSALKILQGLSRGRLIQSQLGRSGGYRMHRPPHEISLLDIVEAIDGPIGPQMPVTTGEPGLAAGVELLQSACHHAAVSLRTALSRYTVADIAQPGTEPSRASA